MRRPGIEPGHAAWEAAILPLNHQRFLNLPTHGLRILLVSSTQQNLNITDKSNEMAKKPIKKKKEEISIDGLNPDLVAQEAVAVSQLGRLLASYGGILTEREKSDVKLLYILGRANKYPSGDSPVIVQVEDEKGDKKCTPKDAIDWFLKKHPKIGKELLAKLESREPVTTPVVKYGLKDKQTLSDDVYVSTISQVLEITPKEAYRLYHHILKPARARIEEESGLVKMAMKT